MIVVVVIVSCKKEAQPPTILLLLSTTFHFLKNICCFPLLVLRGIYHYWIFFQGS